MPCGLRPTLGRLDVGEVLVAPALGARVGVGSGCGTTAPGACRLVQVLNRDRPILCRLYWLLYLRRYLMYLRLYMPVLRLYGLVLRGLRSGVDTWVRGRLLS